MEVNNFLPYFLTSKVVRGYGRGSKELGIPTANLEEEVVMSIPEAFHNGVYYGYVSLHDCVYPMVMSVGTNPYFKNPKRSAEVHILHLFETEFYGETLRIIIIGYIRPQRDYASRDELIQAIQNDISVAKTKLSHETRYQSDAYLTSHNVN